jgi:hypothetical protein
VTVAAGSGAGFVLLLALCGVVALILAFIDYEG